MMMETAYIDIQFKGKSFSPGLLAEKMNLPIKTVVSSGELGKAGRYKGKPVPYGIGLLKINPNVETLDLYSDLLLKNKLKLKKYNVEEIIFDVDANSETLENMSIPGTILKKLSLLNARIQFHNYDVKNDAFALLIKKLFTKVSNISHLNKLETKEILEKLESLILTKSSDLSADYAFNFIISIIEKVQNNQNLSKEFLEQRVEELDKI